MRRERIASVVTALALVLAAVGGGLGPASTTQTAEASILEEDCTLSDALTGPLTIAYNTVMGLDNRCQYDTGANTDYENVSKTDAYSTALGIKDSMSSYTNSVSNFQQDTRAVAYSKAKIEMVRALENGTSESQAKFAANESVRDYYAQMQLNIIKDWNSKLNQIQYLNQTSLEMRMVRTDANNELGSPIIENQTVTLVNGTETTALIITAPGAESDDQYRVGQNPGYSDTTLQAYDPGSSSWTPIVDQPSGYPSVYNAAEDQSSAITSNLDPYVTEVYSQYQSGDLNATDIVRNDPTLLAEQASTNYNETGYYGYAAAQLAAIGAAGDVNASHVISVDGGSNFSGTMFYTGEDRETFQTGETYNFSSLNGTVYLAASDGPNNASGIVNLNQKGSSFTIESATNTNTGDAVQNTTVQKFVYESTNASALQSEIDRLAELRDFYEKQQANSGVGINLGTDDKAIIGVIGAVVLVLALRD